jgi:hypothetical protein
MGYKKIKRFYLEVDAGMEAGRIKNLSSAREKYAGREPPQSDFFAPFHAHF